ncbi:Protein unc-45-like protein B [Trichoplax sp. H2]|nr:Protein unc-45-like protein B [Trichoplax sp. H2]|eukprot:RDD39537.1 Protein unc-45-like protein B [Trichoplax sp. H2]
MNMGNEEDFDFADDHTAKDKGNQYFTQQDYTSAARCYTKALTLCQHKQSTDASIYYKNRAACYLKLNQYQDAITDCNACKYSVYRNINKLTSAALAITPSDTKALFRRCQAFQKLGQLKEAYQEARKLNKLDSKNQAVIDMLRQLNIQMTSQSQALGKTSTKVQQMLSVVLNSSSTNDQKMKALNNLRVVAKEAAGSEFIFREEATWKLLSSLDSETEEVKSSIVKLFIRICQGHRNRMSVTLKEMTKSRLLTMLSSPEEDLCQSIALFLQTALTTLTGCDDNPAKIPNEAIVIDNKVDIDELLDLLIHAMTNQSITISGRSAAINVVVYAIPEAGMTKTFIECKGLSKLLKVAADSAPYFMIDTSASKDQNENTTSECQMHVSVALFQLYKSLRNDQSRLIFRRQCEIFIREHMQYSNDIDMNIGGVIALSALLVGVSEVGIEIAYTDSILQKLFELIASKDLAAKCAATEVFTHICSDKNKCLEIRSQIFPLMKVFYEMKNRKIRIRALVGLCKIGLVDASEVKDWLPEESVLELYSIIRSYLVGGERSSDLKKWSIEALALITLDADAKDALVSDTEALKILFNMAKTKDMAVTFGIASTLVNVTNSYDKPEKNLELEELAKFAQYKIPKVHEKDSEKYVEKRILTMIKNDVVVTLVNLGLDEKSDNCKEKLARVFLALSTEPKHRGVIVQQGGTKILCSLALSGTDKGKSLATQAIAKIGISINPELAFSGQRILETVRPLIGLLSSDSGIQQFEALMALTNLAQVNDTVRRKIMAEKGFTSIEQLMFDDHELIKRAATEAMCNLVNCEEAAEKYLNDKTDRVKLLTLYSGESDFELARAASGTLAILSSNENICKQIIQVKPWLEIMQELLLSEKLELQHRGIYIVANLIEANKAIASEVVESKLLEVLMVLSQETDINKKEIVANAERGLLKAVELGLIKRNK